MNQSSRGLMSAESVAAANKPLTSHANDIHHLYHRSYHSYPQRFAPQPQPQQQQASASGGSIASLFTKSIHQQIINPTISSLPTLLGLRDQPHRYQAGGSGANGLAGTTIATTSNHNLASTVVVGEQRQHPQYLTLTATDTDNYAVASQHQHQHQQSALQQQIAAGSQEASFSEWWSEYWSRQPFPSGYTQSSITLLACLIATIIFLIVVGNLLVCIAIFTEKSLKPTQNWFIASLAVSDMLLGAVVMPFSLARELMGFWIFGPFWCDIHEAMDVLLTTASINTLCLISLDRYWSITQAVNYLKKRTPRRGALMIAFVWVFSAAVSLPPLFGWKKQSPSMTTTTTTPTTNAASTNATHKRQQPDNSSPSTPEPMWRRRRDELATPIMSSGGDNAAASSDELMMMMMLNNPSSAGSAGTDESATFQIDQQQQPPAPTFLSQQPTTMRGQEQAGGGGQQQATTTTTEYPVCQLSDDIGYVLYSALGSFFIPCAVMVFTYIKIFLAARSRARRAISKQTRAGGGANKRASGAARRAAQQAPAATAPAAAITTAGEMAVIGDGQKPPLVQSAPLVKGKIVIVERKKSLAAGSLVPAVSPSPIVAQQQRVGVGAVEQQLAEQEQQVNRATYTCSDLMKGKLSGGNQQQAIPEVRATTATTINAISETCTLTMSGAKQASSSALFSSSASNDSSMITVMNASMTEVPVTRFNFKQQQQSGDAGSCASGASDTLAERDAESRKTAALLKAFSQVAASKQGRAGESELCLDETSSAAAASASPPDIVLERRPTPTDATGGALVSTHCDDAPEMDEDEFIQVANNTNETCFMTIEEDSDMFDAQAGRTIMMIAGNASQKQAECLASRSQGIVMTMQPAQTATSGEPQLFVCNNQVCRRQQVQQQQHHNHHHTPPAHVATRSASSYCGSSLTINDDDIDDCIVDDELLTDDCNGYSVSCGLDQYCPNATFCAHCHECERERIEQMDQNQQHRSIMADNRGCKQLANNNKMMMMSDNQTGNNIGGMGSRRASEAENRSMTGDDNVSLTEYRSNEDSSSIMGHDMLDATESPHKSDKRKSIAQSSGHSKVTIAGGAAGGDGSGQQLTGGYKKSAIGFRLSRLGSSAPLTTHSGGLLALASSSQQQQQPAGGAAGRNLKALRQNFFLKLNQLTAKSAAKNEAKRHRKADEVSATGKSSAQSSGTSYEPSVDYATTSNVHSTDYPPDTTMGELENDYERGKCSENDAERGQSTGILHRALPLDEIKSGQLNGRAAVSAGTNNNSINNNTSNNNNSDDGETSKNVASSMMDRSDNKTVQSDKSDDRVLLLRSNHQPSDGNRRQPLAGVSSPKLGGDATSKSMRFDQGPSAIGNDSQRSKMASSMGSHSMTNNHANMMSSTTGGSGGGTERRAYLASDNERHKRKLAKARERRATLILGLIMAAFICSWLPFFTFYVMRAVCTVCRDYIPPRFEAFIFWMGYCNSAINPIIYTIFNRDFRKAFRKILFKCL